MKNESNSNSGMSFFGTLTLIFVVLKLCNVINWGWLWVLSPLWIGIAIYVLFVVIVSIIINWGGRYARRKRR